MQRRAVLDAGDTDIVRDLRRTTQVLDVVVGHGRAFGVADDVDAGRARGFRARGSTKVVSCAALFSIVVSPPNCACADDSEVVP